MHRVGKDYMDLFKEEIEKTVKESEEIEKQQRERIERDKI